MKLEYLCDITLDYREEPVYGQAFVLVQPYGSGEGSGYGEMDGTVMGDRLQGRVRVANHPHARSDGTFCPDLHGVIVTDDRATILVSLHGYTVFNDGIGKQLLRVIFEAADERYRWLNTTFCVLEGIFDPAAPPMRARIYSCIHELV